MKRAAKKPVRGAHSAELVRCYPLPQIEDDKRFTMGLIFDVGALLQRQGYPALEAADYVELQQALFRFLYS